MSPLVKRYLAQKVSVELREEKTRLAHERFQRGVFGLYDTDTGHEDFLNELYLELTDQSGVGG
jgi:hypothetical protein